MILAFRVFTEFCRPAILPISYFHLFSSSSSYTVTSSICSPWSWVLNLYISSCSYRLPMLLIRPMGLFFASSEGILLNLYMLKYLYFPSVLLPNFFCPLFNVPFPIFSLFYIICDFTFFSLFLLCYGHF